MSSAIDKHITTLQDIPTPRVSIEFCTQCKWMLRAAQRLSQQELTNHHHPQRLLQHVQFAQELLSTFSTSLGEVALIPSTGGVFVVKLCTYDAQTQNTQVNILWDRKSEGGFPETKELKKRVRNIIDPDRDLGHVDGKKSVKTEDSSAATPGPAAAHHAEISSSRPQSEQDGDPRKEENGGNASRGLEAVRLEREYAAQQQKEDKVETAEGKNTEVCTDCA